MAESPENLNDLTDEQLLDYVSQFRNIFAFPGHPQIEDVQSAYAVDLRQIDADRSYFLSVRGPFATRYNPVGSWSIVKEFNEQVAHGIHRRLEFNWGLPDQPNQRPNFILDEFYSNARWVVLCRLTRMELLPEAHQEGEGEDEENVGAFADIVADIVVDFPHLAGFDFEYVLQRLFNEVVNGVVPGFEHHEDEDEENAWLDYLNDEGDEGFQENAGEGANGNEEQDGDHDDDNKENEDDENDENQVDQHHDDNDDQDADD